MHHLSCVQVAMNFMETFLISILMLFFISLGNLDSCYAYKRKHISRTITVSQKGKAHFKTVQQAIDSVPPGNSNWIRILIDHGYYIERVIIPQEKPYIILQGSRKYLTTINFDCDGPVDECTVFTLHASDFVARNIFFKNTHDLIRWENGKEITWAVAATIFGDRSSFYDCSFLSLQDTLWDGAGRHYYSGCNITGAIDFIWGNGQSIYEGCQIRSEASQIGNAISSYNDTVDTSISNQMGTPGFITAQGRESPNETTGFVLKNCHIYGTGTTYLGRAYRDYSRVLFYNAKIDDIIERGRWVQWNVKNPATITFAESHCRGAGATLAGRVSWAKNLTDEEMRPLITVSTFINQDGWLQKQPM